MSLNYFSIVQSLEYAGKLSHALRKHFENTKQKLVLAESLF